MSEANVPELSIQIENNLDPELASHRNDVSSDRDDDLITYQNSRPRRTVQKRTPLEKKTVKKPKTYNQKMKEKLASCQNGEPVTLRECYLRRVMRRIANNGKKSSKIHPIICKFGDSGASCLSECEAPSIEIINPNHRVPVRYGFTYSYLQTTMRKAMLNHNWTYCLRLFDDFIKYEMTNCRYLVYRLRIMLLLIFHLKLNKEQLDKFLRMIMLVHDVNERAKLLKSFHTLKQLRYGKAVIARLTRKIIKKCKNESASSQFSENDV